MDIQMQEDKMIIDDVRPVRKTNEFDDDLYCLEKSIKINKERNLWGKTILNRRKKKLDEMIEKDDDFFSEEAIKERDPILYEIYLGVHDKQPQEKCSTTMSEFLIQEVDSAIHKENVSNVIEVYKHKYGPEQVEDVRVIISKVLNCGIVKLGGKNQIEDEEDELIRLMHIRFLCGGDKEFFDYSKVDNCELYDDVKTYGEDAEEKYFDEEEEESNNKQSQYTGELDY